MRRTRCDYTRGVRERTIRCGYELAKFCRFAGNVNTLTAAPSEALRNAHTDTRMQKPDFECYLICLHVGALGRIQNPIPATSLRDFRMRHHRYTINQLRKVGGWGESLHRAADVCEVDAVE